MPALDGLYKEVSKLRNYTDEQSKTYKIVQDDIAAVKRFYEHLDNVTRDTAVTLGTLESKADNISAQIPAMMVVSKGTQEISRKIYRRQR